MNTLAPFDAIVLGAGISGLVSASVLADQGFKRIAVIDEFPKVGGNHVDVAAGGYSFDIGSFIFQDDSPLLEHFPEILPLYIPISISLGRLTPKGAITRYPISPKDDIIAPGPVHWLRIAASVAYARLFQFRKRNAQEFARYWMGSYFLKQSGLQDYLERFNGVPSTKVDIEFARKRMGWIKEHASIRTHVERLFQPLSPPTNTQLARPLEGFEFLYAQAVDKLKSKGVQFFLNTSVERIERKPCGLSLRAGDTAFETPKLVSTIPLHIILDMCGMEPVQSLQSVQLTSLFFSFEGERGFDQPILFNFSHAGAWKRLTMHSDFYGRINGREFFNVEVTLKALEGSPVEAAEDFRRHVAANNIFRGDLRLEGSRVTTDAYPIYSNNSMAKAEETIRRLREFGIESFGRQGGFDYQPTARVSTLQSEQVLRNSVPVSTAPWSQAGS